MQSKLCMTAEDALQQTNAHDTTISEQYFDPITPTEMRQIYACHSKKVNTVNVRF